MSERRMFAKSIVRSDAFLELPTGARDLYFQLGMEADDDGFVNSPRRIMREIGSNETELEQLVSKNFIILFQTGVLAIKHWKINNLIRRDRYRATKYQEELSQLTLKRNGSYTLQKQETTAGIPLDNQVVYQVTTKWQPTGCQVVNPGKVRLGKDSIITAVPKNIVNNIAPARESDGKDGSERRIPTLADIEELAKSIGSVVQPEWFFTYYDTKPQKWTTGDGKPIERWQAVFLSWNKQEKERLAKQQNAEKTGQRSFEQHEYTQDELDALFTDLDALD